MSALNARPFRLATFLGLLMFALLGSLLTGCDEEETPKADGQVKQQGDGEGWPTEAEAKEAILRVETSINASQTNREVWKVKGLRHEVKSVTFAPKTIQKQMEYGAPAITVYPVRIVYTRYTDYEHKEAVREELGADGTWYLYRDAFGKWTGKYGRD